MKYFEKDASAFGAAKKLLKGSKDREEAIGRIMGVKERQTRLLKIQHRRPKFFEENIEQIGERIRSQSQMIGAASRRITSIDSTPGLKFGSAPVHPMQGTMLNVQTRDAQRKYNSKILGKKRSDILIPLWQ
jgi:hypothetical protein